MLKGKTAVVTGASQGIGRAIALHLAKSGVNLIINYHMNKKAAQKLSEEIIKEGVGCHIVQGNVSKANEARRIIQFALEAFQKLDILVNNAGITRDNLIIRMKEEEFQQVLETNLMGTFNCTKYASKIMVKQHSGKIVNISSVAGISGHMGQANYAASKAGIIGLTKSVAKELASRNINVNVVAPGLIKTSMSDRLSQEQKERIVSQIPLGRLGLPEEVAGLVCFLVSEKADYITGQIFQIDGGLDI